jgi:N-hydroxyarylamine O-acetyltransferase
VAASTVATTTAFREARLIEGMIAARTRVRAMLDLDAYLERIGLSGRPELAELHRAHSTSIPFENLDPQAGRPVSLAPEDLERKLVGERRGGYCFEQNLLLKAALEALGAEVDMYLARVRIGAPSGVVRPRSHLVMRVRQNGTPWLADVGFGMGTPFEPLPWEPGGGEHEQLGWRFRVERDGAEVTVQTLAGDEWVDMYGFLPHPVPLIDVETINWWTSTNPSSPFVSGLLIGTQADDGTRLALSDREGAALTESTPTSSEVTPVERREIPDLLASRFGLPGFALGDDERLRRASG